MFRKLFYAFIWITLMAGPARAGAMNVACAADFTGAMKELAPLYVAQTGQPVNCTFGSTAMLYGQIVHGVPYDLFLAADEHGPVRLHRDGLALSPVTYAKGTMVLWTADPGLASLTDWKAVLADPGVSRIGIAAPKSTVSGERALEAMETTGLYSLAEPKLAFGKSVDVAFQYAYSRTADCAFVTLAQAMSDRGMSGKFWIVDEARALRQAACVLKRGQPESAKRFLKWMRTANAQAIIHKYGYQ